MIDSGEQKVTIIDVRTEEEYIGGHLPETILLSAETIGTEMLDALPNSAWIDNSLERNEETI